MPCSDGGIPHYEVNNQLVANQLLQDKVNSLTRWLCYIFTNYDISPAVLPNGDGEFISPTAWWKKHQEIDRQRLLVEEREKIQFQKEQKAKNEAKKLAKNLDPLVLEQLKRL